jgi:hypothetical protein
MIELHLFLKIINVKTCIRYSLNNNTSYHETDCKIYHPY